MNSIFYLSILKFTAFFFKLPHKWKYFFYSYCYQIFSKPQHVGFPDKHIIINGKKIENRLHAKGEWMMEEGEDTVQEPAGTAWYNSHSHMPNFSISATNLNQALSASNIIKQTKNLVSLEQACNKLGSTRIIKLIL